MKIHEITDALEALAPIPLQEEYDNSGLQVGVTDRGLTGVLVCLDITEQVVDEAIARGMNLVISHHPLIFKPLRQVSDRTWQQRCVTKAVLHGIVLYAAHTNLDNADGGVNHRIAHLLGLRGLQWLEPKADTAGRTCGAGLIGELEETMDAEVFLRRVKDTFHVECLMHSDTAGRTVRKVALCGGAGSFLLGRAEAMGADCFITGEMSYHSYFENGGMVVAALGHYQSEQFTMDLMMDYLWGLFPGMKMEKVSFSTNPVKYMI